MNTLNRKTNEFNKFIYQFPEKLSLKTPNKNMVLYETMQLLGSSNEVIDKNKNGEIVPRLETLEVVLVHCNLVNNSY